MIIIVSEKFIKDNEIDMTFVDTAKEEANIREIVKTNDMKVLASDDIKDKISKILTEVEIHERKTKTIFDKRRDLTFLFKDDKFFKLSQISKGSKETLTRHTFIYGKYKLMRIKIEGYLEWNSVSNYDAFIKFFDSDINKIWVKPNDQKELRKLMEIFQETIQKPPEYPRILPKKIKRIQELLAKWHTLVRDYKPVTLVRNDICLLYDQGQLFIAIVK